MIDRVESTNSLADAVVEARSLLDRGLEDKRRYPREAFKRLFTAVVAYAEATANDELIHRSVVQSVHGLRAYLESPNGHRGGDRQLRLPIRHDALQHVHASRSPP